MATIKIRKKTPVIRYPSSLIQQNHGESLCGHGYTLWNLENKSYKHVEIPNDYGFFTVVMDKSQILTDLTNLPKKARIQFQLFETVATEVKTALTKLRESSEIIETSFSKLEGDASKRQAISPNGVILGNISNRDYQIQLITDHLKNRLNVTDQTFIDQVIAVNDKTNGAIKKDDFARNMRWIPIRFEWDNMFSYGEGNVIDFTKMKDVVGLFASNASGKSSILSALTFCLFDKCEREFKAANILNIQKTNFRCKLEFEIDGKRYFISREGKADRKGSVKVTVRFWKLENDKEVDLHGEDRRDTNEVIRDYLGTYEDFILTSLSVQGGKNNGSVIDMGNTDRKDLLAQFMGLSIFDRLYNEANERFKELATLLKTYRNDDYTKMLVDLNNAVTQANSAFVDESVKVQELTTQQTAVQQKVVEETKNLIKVDGEIIPLKTSQMNKANFESAIKATQSDIANQEVQLATIEKQLIPTEEEIKKLEEKNIAASYKGHQALVTQRVQIQAKITVKQGEVTQRLALVNREKGHKYDPNCKFCVENAGNIITDARSASQELEKDKVEAAELVKQLNDINAKISENEWAVKEYENYTQLLTARNKIKDNIIRHNTGLNRLRTMLKHNQEGMSKIEQDIIRYEENKNALAVNEEVNKRIQVIKLELSNVETLLKVKNKTLMDLNSKVVTFKSQIDAINKKIEEAKKTEAEYKIYETYTQTVCRDGIPFNVITMTVPEIEREVNSILSQISEFSAKFETDGKNIIPYIVYDDKKWLMSLTSGMEKFTLSLAIRVALINISNLPRPNFLVIDEGFGVLDSENLSRMQTLFNFLKTQFSFILVVSHLESLRDMVDYQLEITKENGFSKVNFV